MTAEFLREFHDTFAPAKRENRITLHGEEEAELYAALVEGDREQIARELADVVYVCYGTALAWGIDLDVAIREVHRANMSKVGPDGRPVLREDGKVLKPEGFVPPDLKGALRA